MTASRTIEAQTIRGRITAKDSSMLAGNIAVATDDRGVDVGRALSGARGQFLLTLAKPGTYSVRVLRIGHRPTQGPSLSLAAADTVSVVIALPDAPIMLAAATVREDRTCRVGSDTGLAVARVWEEARKAMLASRLTNGTAPLIAEWIEYDRSTDVSEKIVRSQQVRAVRQGTTHAFKSRSPQLLDDEGYVTLDDKGVNYYAPDADVLLSDEFVASHCFQLAAVDGVAKNLIGVSFEPAEERAEKRDIRGTLWLDRDRAELRTLDFRYTNLPDAALTARAGGRVEFLRLDDGNWLINRWSIRMPLLGAPYRRSADGTRRLVVTTVTSVVRSIQTTGGEVTSVMRGDSVIHRAEGPRLTVQVTSGDALISPRQATLTLDGTNYSATADEHGFMSPRAVLAGRYVARVRTALMDSLEIPSVEREIEVGTGSSVDSVALPAATKVAQMACEPTRLADGHGMLIGGVRSTRAADIAGARIVASWENEIDGGGLANGIPRLTRSTLETRSDADGLWHVCGVPRERAITVRVDTDSGVAIATARLETSAPFAAVALAIAPVVALAVAPSPDMLARLDLLVSDEEGRPVAGARLDIAPAGGEERSVVTSASGRATVGGIAPGPAVVRARRLGLREGQVAADLETGRNSLAIVMGTAAMPMLDTVRTVAMSSVLLRHSEFEARRAAHTAAASITREDIEKRNPTEIWQMITNVPAMKIADRDGDVVAVSTRALRPSILTDKPCYMAVMVDGFMLPMENGGKDHINLKDLPVPADIHGVEVFAGPAAIPPQYGGSGAGKMCGLIAIWTR
ncbi:MAG: carboxypeptidase regulatory-like domain-containing protein [bacterium]